MLLRQAKLFCVFIYAFYSFRNHVCLEAFNNIENNLTFDEPSMNNGIGSLIHAEILLNLLKNDSETVIPSWFIEDITFMFQLADYSDFTTDRFKIFKARVYWFYCNWHYHHGRAEEAMTVLNLVIFIY